MVSSVSILFLNFLFCLGALPGLRDKWNLEIDCMSSSYVILKENLNV